MTPYWESEGVTLHVGDCRKVLPGMAENSVDAIVCDPPYELTGNGGGGFMGKAWDASGVAFDPVTWREALRVLKPGGYLLAFGGTRTYHRMTVAIEDAGFEIRDSLHWIYGGGFPKGQDIAKVIDKRREDRAEVLQVTAWLKAQRDAARWTTTQMDALFGFNGMASHWTAVAGKAAAVPTPEQWDRLRDALGFDDAGIRPLVAKLNGRKGALGEAWGQREVVGEAYRVRRPSDVQIAALSNGAFHLTAPTRDDARHWQGWNTALKPAHEPIVLARKPTGFNTTVANVLEHGTGALNIDACRTAAGRDYRDKCASVVGLNSNRNGDAYGEWTGVREDSAHAAGRWPTNVVFTHSAACIEDEPCEADCPVSELDRQSGITKSSGGAGSGSADVNHNGIYGRHQREPGGWGNAGGLGDVGGASRFFPTFRYQAKAPASERPRLDDGTAHNTVKPVALMRWLVRLVTPPGGTVLDPFAGSGTTAEACLVEGFRCVLVEREQPHAELIKRRLSKPIALDLFGGAS